VRFNVPVTTDPEPDLTPGEQVLLLDAQTDDVSFVWVLIDLGLRSSPPTSPNWRPGAHEIDSAFRALERLYARGLSSRSGASSTWTPLTYDRTSA
jgi:hypothetical protein